MLREIIAEIADKISNGDALSIANSILNKKHAAGAYSLTDLIDYNFKEAVHTLYFNAACSALEDER